MSFLDWIILIVTLTGIICYGIYKSTHTKDLDGYFLGNRSMSWWVVLLSIMGTQASAVTFLSAPGQAYNDGMRFVQYYFGLPIAMVVISAVFVPIFRNLKVYTAYEYLEQRFDLKTRIFTSLLFLVSRGLSTGISIYAPSIILCSLLGWNIYITNLIMGGLLIIYTVSGGAKAVASTQKLQFLIIMAGMFIAAYMVVKLLPQGVGFKNALQVGGQMGKMNIITNGSTSKGFDWNDRYNIWSGLIGGFFLSLGYFGADQSQVGRYLTAKSNKESKIGLLMNGIIKVPMQFFILLVGVLVFAFYQLNKAPIFFNQTLVKAAHKTVYSDTLNKLENEYNNYALIENKIQTLAVDKMNRINTPITIPQNNKPINNENIAAKIELIKTQYKVILHKAIPNGEQNDTNYIFLYFVTHNLPKGLIGLLIAVIILAAWGSIAAALNSLASTSVVDIHRKIFYKNCTDDNAYKLSWQYTLGWGLFSVAISMFATNMGSLIEAVNIIGSLFYGVMLGVFLVAFFFKKIKSNPVFWSAIIVEILVIVIYNMQIISFLWLNAIGAIGVVLLAALLQLIPSKSNSK